MEQPTKGTKTTTKKNRREKQKKTPRQVLERPKKKHKTRCNSKTRRDTHKLTTDNEKLRKMQQKRFSRKMAGKYNLSGF